MRLGYFSPITLYRLYSRLESHSWGRPIGRLLQTINFLLFNAILPATSRLGSGTSLEHRGLGVVIHPKAIVGRDCVIMQNVTIGGRANRVRDGRTCPTIGNRVTVGAGAVVLGPIHIGDDVQIGANAVVLEDIPSGAIAVGVPARVVFKQ